MDIRSQTDTEREVLRKYYKEHDTILSLDGILKIFTVISCMLCSVLHLAGGTCGSVRLAGGGAGAALAGAFVLTASCAVTACSLPTRAPLTWLYTDLVLSTAVGGVLLVSSLLMFTLCHMQSVVDYLHGPFALVSAGLAIVTAVTTYTSVAKRWDEAHRSVTPRPDSRELDV